MISSSRRHILESWWASSSAHPSSMWLHPPPVDEPNITCLNIMILDQQKQTSSCEMLNVVSSPSKPTPYLRKRGSWSPGMLFSSMHLEPNWLPEWINSQKAFESCKNDNKLGCFTLHITSQVGRHLSHVSLIMLFNLYILRWFTLQIITKVRRHLSHVCLIMLLYINMIHFRYYQQSEGIWVIFAS